MITATRKLWPHTLGAAIIFASTIDMAIAASSGHDEHHAEGASGGLPQFDPSSFPSQIFWLAVTFLAMYIFFSNRTLPDISGTLENRREHIQDDIDTAERLKKEAEQAQAAYEESLISARSEAAKTISDAHQKMKAKSENQSKKFREKTEQEIKALEGRLDNVKKEIMEDMNVIAAELARDAAEKVVGISTDIDQAKDVVMALNGKQKKEAA